MPWPSLASARNGLLLDTNILLLHVIGRFDANLIGVFKRTNTFNRKDYDLLSRLVTRYPPIVSTPHILAEVSNLAGNLAEPKRGACFREFAGQIRQFQESVVSAVDVIGAADCFVSLGLADAGISVVALEKFLVVTDDLRLYLQLTREGTDVINFNHIRVWNW